MGDLRHFKRMEHVAKPGRRPAAVLFADLESSSPLARRLSTAGYFALVAIELLASRALRDGWDWHMVVWALLTAAAGIYYLALRRARGRAPEGAQMFEDLKVRERQALEINDNIVQGLTVAKYAMSIGSEDHSRQAIEDTLVRARQIITDLLGEPGSAIELGPGDLRRATPAAVVEKKGPPAA